MPSSKIISIGATAIVLGIIGQATVFWMLYNLASQGSSESAERFDTIIVEQSGFGFNAVTVSLVFMVLGVVVFLWGSYRSVRLTERLAQKLEERDAK